MSTTKYGPKVEAILARKPELAAAWERGRALAVLANYADLLALACARGGTESWCPCRGAADTCCCSRCRSAAAPPRSSPWSGPTTESTCGRWSPASTRAGEATACWLRTVEAEDGYLYLRPPFADSHPASASEPSGSAGTRGSAAAPVGSRRWGSVPWKYGTSPG